MLDGRLLDLCEQVANEKNSARLMELVMQVLAIYDERERAETKPAAQVIPIDGSE